MSTKSSLKIKNNKKTSNNKNELLRTQNVQKQKVRNI